MSTTLFFFLWVAFAIVFLLILGAAGKAAGKGATGALIDERNRYSLNRFQLIMWTVILLSAFAASFFARGLEIPVISAELLGLIGISAASATTAGAVKSSKDVQSEGAKARARVLREEVVRTEAILDAEAKKPQSAATRVSLDSAGATHMAAVRAAAEPLVPNVPLSHKPRPAQVLLEEEGNEADKVVSVTKFQNLILTLVAGVALVVMVVDQKTLDLKLTDPFLWLLGISHGSYVAGKIPNKK